MIVDFTRFCLAEGVNLHIWPTQKFKTTSVSVYCHLPLARETVTQSALLPMVLARGSKDFPTTPELWRRFDNLYGASFDVDVIRTGEVHSIIFRLEMASEQHIGSQEALLFQGISTLAGIIGDPVVEGGGLKADYLKQESLNLRQMIESMIDDKRRWAVARCIQTMCKGEAFGLHRLGRSEDLDAISPTSLKKHHAHLLDKSRIDIFVVGDVELQSIKEMMERAFAFLFTSSEPRTPLVNVVKRQPSRSVQKITEHLDVNQGVVVLGLRTGATMADDGYFPMLVANGVLGAFSHSKLFQQVREKRSLAYFCYSALEACKGICLMVAGVDPAHIGECKELMIEQLEVMKSGGITEYEVRETVSSFLNDLSNAMDNPFSMTGFVMEQSFSNRERSLAEYIDAFKHVTVQQVMRAARKMSLDTVYTLTGTEGGASL